MESVTQKVQQVNTISPETHIDPEDGSVTIYLFENITEESANKVISEIHKHTGKTIQLQLKTNGGLTEESLAIADAVRENGVQVHTYKADSGGFVIFCAADIRTMSENAELMYHTMYYGMEDQMNKHQNYLQRLDKVNAKIHEIITRNTEITKEQLCEYDKSGNEWYIDYGQALSYGLITHVIKEEEQVIPEQYIPESTQTIRTFVPYEKEEVKAKEDDELPFYDLEEEHDTK